MLQGHIKLSMAVFPNGIKGMVKRSLQMILKSKNLNLTLKFNYVSNNDRFEGLTYIYLSISLMPLIPRFHYRAITTIALIVSDRDIQAIDQDLIRSDDSLVIFRAS